MTTSITRLPQQANSKHTTSTDKPFKLRDSDNHYYIRYEGPPDPLTGKRKQVMKSCKGMSYKEAQQFLSEQKRKIALGEFVTTKNQTVEEYLEFWLLTDQRHCCRNHMGQLCDADAQLCHSILWQQTPIKIHAAAHSTAVH